jgi:hypothetical protein
MPKALPFVVRYSSHLPQFRDAPHFHPLDHKDVAFVIEARTVRADELPGDE